MDGLPANGAATRDAVVDLAGVVGGLTAAVVALQTSVIALRTALISKESANRDEWEAAFEQSRLELMKSSDLANEAFKDVLELLEGLGQSRG